MFTIAAVACLPFTVLVRVLVLLFKVLLVEDDTAPAMSKLETTPFTLLVTWVPLADSVLPDITVVVATTPFTVVVRVFPATP